MSLIDEGRVNEIVVDGGLVSEERLTELGMLILMRLVRTAVRQDGLVPAAIERSFDESAVKLLLGVSLAVNACGVGCEKELVTQG